MYKAQASLQYFDFFIVAEQNPKTAEFFSLEILDSPGSAMACAAL